MAVLEILCGIILLVLGVYYYVTKDFNYWKIRGVAGPKPSFPFGNMKDVMLGKIHEGDFMTRCYTKYKNELYFGLFFHGRPVLVIKDLEFVKDVLVKDFSSFADRGLPFFKESEPLLQNLLFLEPKRWQPLRKKLTPVFTSGKLREMFHLLLECAEPLEKRIEELSMKGEPIECRELMAKFATDVIGSCAFGIRMNAMANEDSEFRRMGREIFEKTFFQRQLIKIRNALPRFYLLLNYIIPINKNEKFFINFIKETLQFREENNVIRHDFVDLLSNLKKESDNLGDIEFTDTLLTAQCFVFFIAGFETSASTMSNALYELALNQNIQDRLRKEIREVFEKHNRKITYDMIEEMKYLHLVFKETLRKHPPSFHLARKSMESYTFKGTNLTIPKDMLIWIPNYAIHHDPEIYHKPDIFDPERFTAENVKNRHPMHFLAFGSGPRNCIGSRFANYESKIGLITILKNFKVDVCEETRIPYVVDPGLFLRTPIDGIKLKITKVPGSINEI